MIAGARKVPPHHITIRVPWHGNGWNGTVCNRPLDNPNALPSRESEPASETLKS
jgi:hypothetical protein